MRSGESFSTDNSFSLTKASSNTDIPGVSTKVKGETVVTRDSIAAKFPPPIEVYLAWYNIKLCNVYVQFVSLIRRYKLKWLLLVLKDESDCYILYPI